MQPKEFASELIEDKFVINISNHYFYPQLNYYIIDSFFYILYKK